MSRASLTVLAAVAFAMGASAQDFSEIKLEQLTKDFTFTEGPAWSAKDGYLIFSDTPGDRLLKWIPGQKVELFRPEAHGPSGNAFDIEGRLYTCETRTRRVTRTDKKGAIEVLADKWEGKQFNAPSDIVVSKTGHVYFTDPAFGWQSDHRELDFYGVYHLPPKGPLKLVAKPTGRPHGVALSPNGRTLYVSNADERNVRAYDLDKNGEPSNERVLISGIAGIPGGMRVDEKGNLYVAANGIAVYTPDGKPLHMIEIHGRASNCGFGEADLHTLFITDRGFVYRVRLDVKGAY
ncbi:MAG TPA: SMP-30/gluconolactonase/LRE family protein [Bryobacteraceae bacterium]|jgi:gluconolactonase